MTTGISILKPSENESLEQYTVRAHKMLAPSVKSCDRRNALIRRYWARFRGPTEGEQIARECFAADKYERVPDVCCFMEHDAAQPDGSVKRYGLKELASIVRHNNRRIEDNAAFTAISDGHTSPIDDPNPRDPGILGFAGPYRLGMIGRKQPKWAIFHDEHQRVDAKPILSQKPRRSVELLTYKDTGEMFFDPIAALGAEAPRLPLPVRFSSVRRGDVTVERYSAASVFAFPGGSNTFVKGGERNDCRGSAKPAAKTRYQESTTMLSPEDKAELLDAISSLPQFKFLDQLMSSPQAQAMLGGGEEEAAPVAPVVGGDEEIDVDLGEDLAGGDAVLPAAGADDEKPGKYAMQYGVRRGANGKIEVERYAALERSYKKLLSDHGKLNGEVQEMRKENIDAKRTTRLQQLAGDYPHIVDFDEEATKTLYSLGASMSDADFETHIATVERYAQRAAPATRLIPIGELPRKSSIERADYSAKRSQLAVDIATRSVNGGKVMDWDDALAEAEKQLKQTG